MKTCVIFHSVDLDGWMSAAIVKHWFKQQYDLNYEDKNQCIEFDKLSTGNNGVPLNDLTFIGYNYGQPIPDLSEYDKVIMCDISFPAQEMKKIVDKTIWIDHHISAILAWQNIELCDLENKLPKLEGLRDTNFAACELTWLYLFPNEPMPEIVRLLGRYDCFGHKTKIFDITTEGYTKAKEYLKGLNKLEEFEKNNTSVDGYSLVYYANNIAKKLSEETKVLEFQYGARQYITNYEQAYKELVIGVKEQSKTRDEVLTTYRFEDIHIAGISIYKYLCTEAKQTYKNGFEVIFWIDTIPTDEEIRPIPAIGICDICGKAEDKQLIRYYFRYENDKCDCHSPYHFDVYDCCQGCKPVPKNKVPKRFICINKERFNPINFGIDYHSDGYDGCACFHYANGMWNFSLYNDNGEVDVSQIAKQYGGGGHKGASGMALNTNDFLKLIS